MNNFFDIAKRSDTSTGSVYLTKDKLIVFHPNPDLTAQNTDEIQENINTYKQLMNGERLPFITDFSNALKLGSKEKNLIRNNLDIFYSLAIVTTKSISRVILNLFLQFHLKEPPVKIFSTIEEAKKWSLENFSENNQSA